MFPVLGFHLQVQFRTFHSQGLEVALVHYRQNITSEFPTGCTTLSKATRQSVIFATNCSVLAPMGYQTNLLVLGPRHYKFSDYLRGGGLQVVLFLAYIFTPSRTLVVWSTKDIQQNLSS